MAETLDLLDMAKHIVHGTFESTFCVVCLSCLDDSNEKVSNNVICYENKEYSTALIMNEVFRIEITDHDNYSLCSKCFKDVTSAYKTYTLARENNEILNTIVESLYNQIENLELSEDTYPCLVVPNFEQKNNFLENNYVNAIKNENNTEIETAAETENYFEFDDNASYTSKVILDLKQEEEDILSEDESIEDKLREDKRKKNKEQEKLREDKRKKYKKRILSSYLQCSRCSVKYKFVAKLISHMKNDHGVNLFVCKLCQHMSEDSNEHSQHMNVHKDVYSCSICDSTFKRLENLEMHIRKHDSEKQPHTCELCGLATITEYALRMHLEKNHPRKKFMCNFCGKMYKMESSFDAHIEKHHKWMGGSHKCSICPRNFSSADQLSKHTQSAHELTAPYTCRICDDSFRTEDMLKTHVKKHDGRHICQICNATFTHPRSLMWHQRLHSDEKPYACNVCGRRFVSSSRCWQHSMCAHSAPSRRCPLCPALFHLTSMVNTHIKKVHLKYPKRNNRCSKFENVTWKTQVVPLQDLSVSIQNDIMELNALQKNSVS